MDVTETQGYVYGNITSKLNISSKLTLVVVDSEYFMEFYGNSTVYPRSKACSAMFRKIDRIAFDRKCNHDGPMDFLRQIPCAAGQLCSDEDNSQNVMHEFQFTYSIQDLVRPRFWYFSIVSCHRDSINQSSCSWTGEENAGIEIDYDIWIVNGHPFKKHINPFEHQFSFENHDIFEIYFTFLILYIILVPIWFYACAKLRRHSLSRLIAISMVLQLIGIVSNLIHVLKFAFDGVGVTALKIFGNGIDTLAECVFVLILLLIAKGFCVTCQNVASKRLLFTVWIVYSAFTFGLFIWTLLEVDIISNIEEWETWPGYLILAFRLIIMIYFLYQLRQTAQQQHRNSALQFFQHFGAFFLVWFIYLPVLTVISTQVSALWKHKTVLTISYSVDFLSYAILVHLLWPSRSTLSLIKEETAGLPEFDLEITGLLDDDQDVFLSEELELNLVKATDRMHITADMSDEKNQEAAILQVNGSVSETQAMVHSQIPCEDVEEENLMK